MWGIENTFVGATTQAIRWCHEAGMVVFKIGSYPSCILVVSNTSRPAYDAERFATWSETATVIAPERVRAESTEEIDYYPFPDRSLLLHHKWMALQMGVPVAFYSHETFGGSSNFEFAWEFGSCERVLVFEARGRVIETTPDARRPLQEPSVLVPLLRSFGVESNGYFEPHRRGFQWGKYRIDPPNQ